MLGVIQKGSVRILGDSEIESRQGMLGAREEEGSCGHQLSPLLRPADDSVLFPPNDQIIILVPAPSSKAVPHIPTSWILMGHSQLA